MTHYDVIIVGAGAGGGVAAGVLAEAGKRVLLLERGQQRGFAELGRDHMRNHRLSQYGHNTGPDLEGNPRVAVDLSGQERVVAPNDGAYHNNAAAVGGGTLVYGAQAWRFLPDDFAMASRYGVPEGSSLADWPLSYADLAPYYERAEQEIGVAGDSARAAAIWPRDHGFPMPPMLVNNQGRRMRSAAEQLGWGYVPVPLLINTEPRQGRDACIHCQHCVGFGCPVNAKNGTQNTMIPRALATGRCELVAGAMVKQIDTDGAGHVIGITYVNCKGETVHARGSAVVVAAGAIETARLLLHSTSPHHPHGLGNQHDQVGRHLQGHYYARASGFTEEPIYDGIGPGVTTATTRFNHGNAGIIGGGMLADEFITLPIVFRKRFLPPGVARWGAENKAFMRDQYRRFLDIAGPVQEIPHPDARVTLDPHVRDRWGMPVARLSGATHPETVRATAFMAERAQEWLQAAGAQQIWSKQPGLGLSAGQHQAGTCRMGDDPRSSVTDSWGRVHGHDNLFVSDGSLHVTNGGFNPVLTILALAFRVAEGVARS